MKKNIILIVTTIVILSACYYLFNRDTTMKSELSGKRFTPDITFNVEEIANNPLAAMLIPALEKSMTIEFTDTSVIIGDVNTPITYTETGYIVGNKKVNARLDDGFLDITDSTGINPFSNSDISVQFVQINK